MIALNKLPKKWRLEIQQETDEANGEVDFVLQEELEELNEECDEHAEYTLSHELIYDFEPFAEISEGALPPDTTCNSHQILRVCCRQRQSGEAEDHITNIKEGTRRVERF